MTLDLCEYFVPGINEMKKNKCLVYKLFYFNKYNIINILYFILKSAVINILNNGIYT